MSEFAIRAEGLSKQYRIGATVERYPTIRARLAGIAGMPFRALRARGRRSNTGQKPTFWALKDVSFEIAPGEVVGVIGRNGAGKSTLLKVLSRITEPTAGKAKIRGRVGSLLEVGTGFHQELTGRENIYLNGAILGMKRAETDRKFDEIVDFAEVGAFIDTPVKHYSSGMHLRLAFSVAAHLEPEILLVDEVLAVGDVAFQRKCLGKMETVAARGRTVLFVSHNLGAVKELCQTSIVLDHGSIAFRGSVIAGLSHYTRTLLENPAATPAGSTRWSSVAINGRPNGLGGFVESHAAFEIEGRLDLRDSFTNSRLICLVNDPSGTLLVHRQIRPTEVGSNRLPAGCYRIGVGMPPLWLAPGLYTVYFKFFGMTSSGAEERHESERAIIDVTGDMTGISRAQLAPALNWTVRAEPFSSSTMTAAPHSVADTEPTFTS